MSFHKKLDSFILAEGHSMHGEQKKWSIARFLTALLLATGLLVTTGGDAAQAAPADCSSPAEPSSGAIGTYADSSYQMATFSFELDPVELQNLKCAAPYLEIDFHLEGLFVPWEWDGYVVLQTNLPGALHDVAAGDFTTSTPGVTRIYTSQMYANVPYKVTIAWQSHSAIPGQTPGVWVAWVPSHTAQGWDQESYCAVAPYDWRGEAWCIFPYSTAVYYYRQGAIGINQLDFDGSHIYGFGSWASNQIPPSIQMLPSVSLAYDLLPYLPLSPSRQLFLRGDSMLFAKDTLINGGWTEESASGSISKIAVGGATQMVLNACNAVFARSNLGIDGWTQETPCGGAQQIAVSSTGLQVLLDANFAVWAKYGVGDGGWIRETDDYSATKIAVGGNTQMLIDPDGAVHAKTWLGYGGWVKEHAPQNPADKATAIAADNTGMQAFIRSDAAVFAKRGVSIGGWQQQVGFGNADAIAAGSGVLLFLRGDGALFAKTDISFDGGWQLQADPHTVTAIAMGNSGRMMIRSNTNAIYAKDNLINGDWHLQVGDGNAIAIAVG